MRRLDVRRLLVVSIAAILAQGCTLTIPTRPAGVNRLPPARRLVLPRSVDRDENRPLAESASDLLVRRLRQSGEVLGARQFLGEATAAGLGAWAGGFMERVQRGVLWRIRGDSEVENKQGRSFQFALEQAVEAVVEGIHPRDSLSLTGLWKEFRR